MIKFKQYIDEMSLEKNKWQVVLLKDLDQKLRHTLWDMYVDTYQSIGLHIESPEKLTSKYKISWLIDLDKDPIPDAFVIYKETKHGSKLALAGSDGTKESKSYLVKKFISLMKTKGWYAEASGVIAGILTKNNVKLVTDIDKIKKVIGKPDIEETDEKGVYKRKLGTLGMVKKQLFGTPK